MDKLFYRQLQEISGLAALVIIGGFNLPDTNLEYCTTLTNKSGKFLKHVENNFVLQVVSVPTRKLALLDLLFQNRKGLV